MLAIGLDGSAAALPYRPRPTDARGRPGAERPRARPIRRSMCRSIRAGGISCSTARTVGRRSPPRRHGATPRSARAPNSISRSSACCWTPAPGPQWRYRDAASGASIGRSEGLALASLAMFERGAFSSRPGRSVASRCGGACSDLSERDAGATDSRSTRRQSAGGPRRPRRSAPPSLGKRVAAAPEVFASRMRRGPAGCSIVSRRQRADGASPAPAILAELLRRLGRSGRRGSSSVACRSATAGGTRNRDRRCRPTVSCRCTSCRSGWPIR